MVLKTREDLPEPDTPVNTVIRRLGISSETFLRFVLRRAADGDRTVVGVGHRLVLSHLIELWRESFPDLPRSSPAPSSTCFTLPLSADAYAMQLCKQGLAGLALNCAGRLQSIRANTCSRAAKNCCHPPLAPW
jgi:hypothetical protein